MFEYVSSQPLDFQNIIVFFLGCFFKAQALAVISGYANTTTRDEFADAWR